MSIYYDKKRDQYQVNVMRNGISYRKWFRDKNEALKWETYIKTSNPKTLADSKTPLGKWMIIFLERYKKPYLQETSYKRVKQTAAHLAPLSRYPIGEIPTAVILDLYAALLEKLSDESVSKVHKLLKSALMRAWEEKMIFDKPMTNVKAPKITKKPVQVFSKDEIERIKATLTESNKDLLIYTLMVTGARPGELLALRPLAVREKSIYICENKKNLSGQVFGSPKTSAGTRTVPITPTLAKKLRTAHSFVFHTVNDTAYDARNINRYWQSFLKRAGVEYKELYTLRHTFATQLLAKGIPITEVARILGHKDPHVTLTRYAGFIEGYDDIITNKLEEIYGAG